LAQALAQRGIQTSIHYPRAPHQQAAYAHLPIHVDAAAQAGRFGSQCLSLPIGPHLDATSQDLVATELLSCLEDLA
jgi:dTDP-4-amino-4,6-dideoxygalactose transaminase